MGERGLKKIACYLGYYFFARHLPDNNRFVVGALAKRARRFFCRGLFGGTAPIFGVEKGARFDWGSNVYMDDHANIGIDNNFTGRGKIVIGKHVIMGPEVMIISQNHKLEDGRLVQGYDVGDVCIGDFSWIGARVIILKGVKIGEHCIVGAGAVVTRDLPAHSVCVGVPARPVKSFDPPLSAPSESR